MMVMIMRTLKELNVTPKQRFHDIRTYMMVVSMRTIKEVNGTSNTDENVLKNKQ